MKIDSTLNIFFEKYDKEAIQSIEKISTEYGLNINESTISGFTIKDGFDQFLEFVTGYASHKIGKVNSEDDVPHEKIVERATSFIRDKLFQESQILYSDLPTFVKSYIDGIKSISEAVDKLKGEMIESGVDADSIASINEFTDVFIDRLNESFDPSMDKILWASGYYSRKAITDPQPKEKVVFI